MKKSLLAILICFFAVAVVLLPQGAFAVMINFDGFADYTPLTNQYAAEGINFEDTVALANWNQSYAPSKYTGDGVAYSGTSSTSTFLFDEDLLSFSLIATADNDTLNLYLYGDTGLLDTYSLYVPIGDWYAMTPDLTGLDINKIVIEGVSGNYGYDNVTFEFESSVVPEPATLLLLGSGLLGLFGLRRRSGSRV